MTTIDNQQVAVFVNKKNKFVHIGVYNMLNKNGVPNYGAQLSSHITEAKRIKRVAGLDGYTSADISFGNSFTVRLMNTDFDGWETAAHVVDLDLKSAQSLAIKTVAEYEELGYSITGSIGNKAIRHFGITGLTSVVIKNATKSRLNDITRKLVEGIDNVDLPKVQNAIYRQYNYNGLDTRRKFWYFIFENLDNYLIG